MPEIHLCVFCEKPIYENSEEYIIPNKQQDKPDNWKYLHFSCYELKAQQNGPIPKTNKPIPKINKPIPKTLEEVLEVSKEVYSGKKIIMAL